MGMRKNQIGYLFSKMYWWINSFVSKNTNNFSRQTQKKKKNFYK